MSPSTTPFPYAEVEFTTAGTPAEEDQIDDALAMLTDEQVTDVMLIAHGWNNDLEAARGWYGRVMDLLAALLPDSSSARLGVIGVFWPSIRWADGPVAGGGVSVGDDATGLSLAIDEAVDDAVVASDLRAAIGDLDSPAGRARFVEAARRLLEQTPEVIADDEDGVPSALMVGDPDALFEAVRDATLGEGEDVGPAPGDAERAPGVAPDLLEGDQTRGAGLFGLSWTSLARRVLNTFTYYTMKARAGDVGTTGVAPLVDRINAAPTPPSVHLVGHSFGARVMSAAATEATSPLASMTLLQGAFSHFGFTEDYAGTGQDGAFRDAVVSGRITGPLVITHTHNDTAVRVAYAIASRLARQTGAGLGDASDLYGGIGANGSVGTQALALPTVEADQSYDFVDGAIHNLLADAHISGHSDVSNPAVANVLASAMGLR